MKNPLTRNWERNGKTRPETKAQSTVKSNRARELNIKATLDSFLQESRDSFLLTIPVNTHFSSSAAYSNFNPSIIFCLDFTIVGSNALTSDTVMTAPLSQT